ncbi:phosphatidyl inositol kinase [Gonapodya sp. JEL0774]|nr:phosphatidyl inositol kinase [Gonapodya sp. JEL0774]
MPISNVVVDKEHLKVILTAELSAIRPRAWNLLANPRELEQWWGPPQYPATVTVHQLHPGGRVEYFMTGPKGDKHGGYWKILKVEEGRSITAQDGFQTPDGAEETSMPTTEFTMSLDELSDGSKFTIVSKFPNAESMEELEKMGMVHGLTEAVGQIDAILSKSQGSKRRDGKTYQKLDAGSDDAAADDDADDGYVDHLLVPEQHSGSSGRSHRLSDPGSSQEWAPFSWTRPPPTRRLSSSHVPLSPSRPFLSPATRASSASSVPFHNPFSMSRFSTPSPPKPHKPKVPSVFVDPIDIERILREAEMTNGTSDGGAKQRNALGSASPEPHRISEETYGAYLVPSPHGPHDDSNTDTEGDRVDQPLLATASAPTRFDHPAIVRKNQTVGLGAGSRVDKSQFVKPDTVYAPEMEQTAGPGRHSVGARAGRDTLPGCVGAEGTSKLTTDPEVEVQGDGAASVKIADGRAYVGNRHRSMSAPFHANGIAGLGTDVEGKVYGLGHGVDPQQPRDSGFHAPIVTDPGHGTSKGLAFGASATGVLPRSQSFQPQRGRERARGHRSVGGSGSWLRQNISRRFSQLHTLLTRPKPSPTPYSHLTTLGPPPPSPTNPIPPLTPTSTAQFALTLHSVVRGISVGVDPLLIAKGSSGSYFARNEDGNIVGVYKPRDEEPYGAMNPKWAKWVQRNFAPCMFGRNCLIPNLGYVSEAAASFVDRKMGLNIVPRTEIVSLASPAFHYSTADRRAYAKSTPERPRPLPPKTGSFQLFVSGFKDSGSFFKEGYERAAAENPVQSGSLCRPGSAMKTSSIGAGTDYASARSSVRNSMASMEGFAGIDAGETTDTESSGQTAGARGKERETVGRVAGHPMGWSERTQKEFQLQFERLVVLDYLIRNTDRGMDNWLVRYNAELEMQNEIIGTSVKPPAQQVALSGATDVSSKSIHIPSIAPARDQPFQSDPITVIAADSHSSPTISHPQAFTPCEPTIRIAAIDNGLAFPHKHPDQWRSYPFGWAFLPIARVPFSESTRELVLPLLTNESWWTDLFDGLEQLFRVDPGFDEGMWRKQKAVMRGQGYNLVEILRRSEIAIVSDNPESGSPWALVRRPNVMVYEEECFVFAPNDIPEGVVGAHGLLGRSTETPPTPSHETEGKIRRRIRTVRQR